RSDRDAVVEQVNWSPRAGVAIGVAPEGRAILRGGVGKFVQRTPLNIEAFPTFEPRTVVRVTPEGAALGPPIAFVNRIAPDLHTPEALVANVEWTTRFARRLLLHPEPLPRRGSPEFIPAPAPAAQAITP